MWQRKRNFETETKVENNAIKNQIKQNIKPHQGGKQNCSNHKLMLVVVAHIHCISM